MNPFRPVILRLISLVGLMGIYGWAQAQPIRPPFDALEGEVLYNAAFSYREKQVSGLMVIKAKAEAEAYQIVMLSKLGPTIMEFTVNEEGVAWRKLLDVMDKSVVKKIIEKDFKVILLTHMMRAGEIKRKAPNIYKIKGKPAVRVKLDEMTGRIVATETRGFPNLFKTSVTYGYTDEDAQPDEICLTHRNIKMKIELNILPQ